MIFKKVIYFLYFQTFNFPLFKRSIYLSNYSNFSDKNGEIIPIRSISNFTVKNGEIIPIRSILNFQLDTRP